MSKGRASRSRGQFVQGYLQGLSYCLDMLDCDSIDMAIEWIGEAGSSGRAVFTCGNGGSASIASHFVADLVHGATRRSGIPFRAICLTDSMPTVTAVANDEDYEHALVRPLINWASQDDVLLAISGSGNSRNILLAVEYAKKAGCRTIGLTSGKGGQLRKMVDLPIEVDSDHFGHLEDSFMAICHIVAFAFGDEG